MRRLLTDAINILLGAWAGLNSYLLLGFSRGFYSIDMKTLLICTAMGLCGALIPTLWETFTSSRDVAKISHSWSALIVLLIAIHLSDNPLVDAGCFGYLFHLFWDTRYRKLAPIVQLKSCNRKFAYGVIVVIYIILIAYAAYASQHAQVVAR